MFGDRASSLAIAKGDKIYCEGRVKLDTWTGKDGKERTDIKVSVWRVERLGEIGKNKPAAKTTPAEASPALAAPARIGDRRPPARDWQRPDEGEIPLAPEVW